MSIGLLLFIVAVILWHIGLFGMFKKAGIEGWKALIPLYNTWCMVDKMKLNKSWFFLQLIPIAGQFITIWICGVSWRILPHLHSSLTLAIFQRERE